MNVRGRGLAACAIALATAWSSPLAAQSLVEELRVLVENHPRIQSKQKAIRASEEGVRAARSGYLPTVKVTADTGPEYVDNSTRRNTEGKPFYKGRETSGLVVTQHLFDGNLTDSEVEGAKARRDKAEADLRQTRQQAILDGVLAYTDVLRQAKQIELARDNERKIQEQLSLEDERVQKGSGIASDVLAAKQRLQVAKERRVNFEGKFHTAVARYTQLFGHAPDVARLIDPPVPAALIPPQLEDAMRAAQQDNPTIEVAAKTIAVSTESRRSAESGYYPTIDLVGRADYENDKNATVGVRRDWSLLLTASWELFSGFKTDARVAQASYDLAASRDDHLDTSRRIEEAVKKGWHELATARERMGLLENAAVLAEEVWKAQQKRREAGKATVQDVLDEETRINDARISYTVAYYDMIDHSYEVLAAMGRLEVEGIEQAPVAPGKLSATRPQTQLTKPQSVTPPPLPAAAPAPAPIRAEPPPPAGPGYLPVNASTVGNGIPDGSPAAMQARIRQLMGN